MGALKRLWLNLLVQYSSFISLDEKIIIWNTRFGNFTGRLLRVIQAEQYYRLSDGAQNSPPKTPQTNL